jgi:hypothetical protein
MLEDREQGLRAQFKDQADRLVQQAEIMERQQARLDGYKAELVWQAEKDRRQAERKNAARDTARTREFKIRDSHSRYGQALRQHYDIRDPYRSLARAFMVEYGAFLRDREYIGRHIAQAEDPATRRALKLRRRIEAAEYLEITSNRIAEQSEIIVGRRNTDEAVKQRKRAATFREEAQGLREQYRELQMSHVLYRTEPLKPVAPKTSEPEPKEKLVLTNWIQASRDSLLSERRYRIRQKQVC